ncbi:hypothetical protein HY798_02855 [Candidatus Falkowbacteria bacterium]|nr:hypothetical protein [Candidatus Falkowbacteria bacterium]
MANREARLCAPNGSDSAGQNAWAVLRTATEMEGKFAKSLIVEYIYNKVRTDFLKNS